MLHGLIDRAHFVRLRASKALRFWRLYGTRAFFAELHRRRVIQAAALTAPRSPLAVLGSEPAPDPMAGSVPVPATPAGTAPAAFVAELIRSRFNACDPLPISRAMSRRGPPGVSLVTDSINHGSLFGGVGTAMILSALLARARGARLRVITRTEPAQAENLDSVFNLFGLDLREDVEFCFAPAGSTRVIELADGELVLTTSWWTTASALGSVPAQQIIYLLQEDERMFYPLGDDHLRCHSVLADTRLRLTVNTSLLLQHLAATGIPGLEARALAFEPAFPPSIYHPRGRPAAQRKHSLLFYARPNHPRNLFHFGLDLLDHAITSGVIDLERWDIDLVGLHLPALRFGAGCEPKRHEGLDWRRYAELVGRTDLGLSLMYTPHPSYPPLDLAASGAVVVTNSFGIKQDLNRYSHNILCAPLERDAMLATLAAGLRLAEDGPERQRRFAGQQLATDWATTLAPVVHRFA